MFQLWRRHKLTTINELGIVGFFLSTGVAVADAIWAIFVRQFVATDAAVGFLTSLFSIISIMSLLLLVPVMEKHNKFSLLAWSIGIQTLVFIVFTFTKSFWLFIFPAIIYLLMMTVRLNSFGILIRDESKQKELSENEGYIYTIVNVGWLIGPLIGGLAADIIGINLVFTVAAVFFLISLITLFFLIPRKKIEKRIAVQTTHTHLLENLKEFVKYKDQIKIYIVSGGMSIWMALIAIYVPLMIMEAGLGARWVGYFLFAGMFPLAGLEYFFSRLADKGFKQIFIIGYIILALGAIAAFFFSNIFTILLILVIANIGLAMLEPTTETYFFKITPKKKEDQFYGPYNTCLIVGGFIGKFIPAIVLLFLPQKFIFPTIGILLLIVAYIASTMREVSKKEHHQYAQDHKENLRS